MTQHGETDNFSASDHVGAIVDHTHKDILDVCLINNAVVPKDAKDALGRYEEERSFPVTPDAEKIRSMGIRVVATDLLGITDYVRHDSKKLNESLIRIIEANRVIKRYE